MSPKAPRELIRPGFRPADFYAGYLATVVLLHVLDVLLQQALVAAFGLLALVLLQQALVASFCLLALAVSLQALVAASCLLAFTVTL